MTALAQASDTGDLIRDLVAQAARLNRFYASREGRVISELLGASVSEIDGQELLRRLLLSERRQPTVERLRSGVARGLFRDDLDPDLMHDILFGAAVLRLFHGLPPLTDAAAANGAVAILDGFRGTPPRAEVDSGAMVPESGATW